MSTELVDSASGPPLVVWNDSRFLIGMGTCVTALSSSLSDYRVTSPFVIIGMQEPESWHQPMSRSASFVAEHFRQLAKRWREETDTPSSDLNETLSNRSYLAIIAMGWPVVPCILSEMQRHADHWGPALEAITGENPVSDESEGDIEAISADWVAWGYRNHQLESA